MLHPPTATPPQYVVFPLGLGEEGGQRWQREGWLGGAIGIYSREYGRLFWKNPLGRKLHVTSAPGIGFVTSLMLLERLEEGERKRGGSSRFLAAPGSLLEIWRRVTDQRGVRVGWMPQIPEAGWGLWISFIARQQGAYRGEGREDKAGRRNGFRVRPSFTWPGGERRGLAFSAPFLHSHLTLGSCSASSCPSCRKRQGSFCLGYTRCLAGSCLGLRPSL